MTTTRQPILRHNHRPAHEEASTQQRILDYIRDFYAEHNYPPSRREICEGAGLSSVSIVEFHLKQLARQGVLTLTPGKARGITLVSHRRRAMQSAADVLLKVRPLLYGLLATRNQIDESLHLLANEGIIPKKTRP